MARVWYHRLLASHGPAGSAAAVLAVLVDLAGDTLSDVDVTRSQIEQRLWARRGEDASAWGCGVDTVARALKTLEALGWIGITHAHIPSQPGKLMLRIRLHVAPHADAAWKKILKNSEQYRKLRAREAATARKAAAGPARAATESPAAPVPQGSTLAGDASRPPAAEGLAEPDGEPVDDVAEAVLWAQRAIRQHRRDLADVLTVIAQRWGPDSPAGQAARRRAQQADREVRRREQREAEERIHQQRQADAKARQEAAERARAARDGP